jgi:hypothetical protein
MTGAHGNIHPQEFYFFWLKSPPMFRKERTLVQRTEELSQVGQPLHSYTFDFLIFRGKNVTKRAARKEATGIQHYRYSALQGCPSIPKKRRSPV